MATIVVNGIDKPIQIVTLYDVNGNPTVPASASLWNYAAAAGGITDTVAVTIKTAAAAGIKNYLTGLQIQNSAVIASEVLIRKGAGGTVLWRGYVAGPGTIDADFATPLSSDAAQLLEVVMGTTATATRINAQGYTGV